MESVKIYLLDKPKSNVQYGLNWGQRENREPNQAYLQLEPDIYKGDFFPKKGKYFVVDTDDNTTLIFNRAQKTADGCALHTPENNSIIGLYLRKRLGLANGAEITRDDILNYGKLDIDIFKVDDLHYSLNFSKNWKTKDIRYIFEQYLLIYEHASDWREVESITNALKDRSILLSNKEFPDNMLPETSFNDVFSLYSETNLLSGIDKERHAQIKKFIRFLHSDFFKRHYEVQNMKAPHNYATSGMPLQLICYGAPGTGKSHLIDEMTDDENSIRTTFHPDTDYASFVGAYKPTMAPMPVYAAVGIDLKHARNEEGEKAYEQKIIYKYVPQAFLKAYVAAWSNLEKPFYLVIEEINRGNCAQIFGDLFQLLDRNNTGSSSYPIHADEDIQRFLGSDAKGFASLNEKQKESIRNFALRKDNGKIIPIGEELLNGTKLLLPPNLHIWATMNTSDQSLFPIDSAFKRRWNWKYIPIDYDKENWTFAIGNQRYSWGDFLRKINPEIYALTESADKQMGFYFAKADPQNGVISEDVFVNKVLFYLWTDVFKDYDISGDLFRNKEQNRPFRFSDFFEDSHALETFIQGIGLEPEAKSQEPTLPQEYENNNMEDKYILDGTGYKSIGEVVQAIISALAKEYSFADIEKKFKSFITKNRKGEPAISKEKIEVLQAKENGGPNRWYKNAFISKDGIEFHLFNGWYDHDYKAIKNLVDDCRNIFPNGIQQQPTSNK